MSSFPPWQSCPIVSYAERPRTQAALFRSCLQFDVARNPRYRQNQQGKLETYCNIFAWDVSRALGCEIPHWLEDANGDRRELSALGCIEWLRESGDAAGWRASSREGATSAVVLGQPTVVTWQNPKPGHSSHIAVVLPPHAGELRIAQAGASNLFDVPLAQGFGGAEPLEFWVHQ